jgi:hypothetical protein
MDYGKYKYQEAKKQQQQLHKASKVETNEIKFRPKTEEHDMDFKVKHVRRFLEGGNKVRLAMVLRGREITHPHSRLTGLPPSESLITITAIAAPLLFVALQKAKQDFLAWLLADHLPSNPRSARNAPLSRLDPIG